MTQRQTETKIPLSTAVDAKADRLMEELFAEIDEVLESDPPALPEATSSRADDLRADSALAVRAEVPAAIRTFQPEATATVAPRHWTQDLDRVFFATASIILAAISGFLYGQLQSLDVSTANPTPASTAPDAPELSPRDARLLAHLEGSLAAIEREVEAAERARERLQVGSLALMPRPIAPSPAVPVEPPPQSEPRALRAAVPEPVAVPTIPLPPATLFLDPEETAPSTPPTVAIAPTPEPTAVEPAPAVPPAETAELPSFESADPVIETVEPPPPPAPAAETIAPPPPPAPAAEPAPAGGAQTLLGLVDLGDRSMALIATGSGTQQIGQGEAIEGSDWVLQGVSDRGAILRHVSGKERIVSVGEKF